VQDVTVILQQSKYVRVVLGYGSDNSPSVGQCWRASQGLELRQGVGEAGVESTGQDFDIRGPEGGGVVLLTKKL